MMFWKKDKKEQPADTHPATPATDFAPSTQPDNPAPAADAAPSAGDAPAPNEGEAAPAGTAIDATMTEAKVIEAIRTCYDPEIPVNIYELGLIYEVNVKPSGEVAVKMTLTSPMCPVAGTLPHEVEAKVASVKGVKAAQVDVVWDPPWTPEKMSEAAKLQLGML